MVIKKKFINGIMQYLRFCLLLLLFSILSVHFTHIVARSCNKFLLLYGIPLCEYTTFFSIPLMNVLVFPGFGSQKECFLECSSTVCGFDGQKYAVLSGGIAGS